MLRDYLGREIHNGDKILAIRHTKGTSWFVKGTVVKDDGIREITYVHGDAKVKSRVFANKVVIIDP